MLNLLHFSSVPISNLELHWIEHSTFRTDSKQDRLSVTAQSVGNVICNHVLKIIIFLDFLIFLDMS